MQREQVHALALGAGRAEPGVEICDEVAGCALAVVELRRELHEAAEVGLADHLPLAELLGRALDPPCVGCIAPHRSRHHRRRLQLA